MDTLFLPALQKIIFGHGLEGRWPQRTILDFLNRAGNDVKVFQSIKATVSGQDIVPLMRAMPKLTEFEICCTPISKSAFVTLNSEGLVPGLRIFRVNGKSLLSKLPWTSLKVGGHKMNVDDTTGYTMPDSTSRKTTPFRMLITLGLRSVL